MSTKLSKKWTYTILAGGILGGAGVLTALFGEDEALRPENRVVLAARAIPPSHPASLWMGGAAPHTIAGSPEPTASTPVFGTGLTSHDDPRAGLPSVDEADSECGGGTSPDMRDIRRIAPALEGKNPSDYTRDQMRAWMQGRQKLDSFMKQFPNLPAGIIADCVGPVFSNDSRVAQAYGQHISTRSAIMRDGRLAPDRRYQAWKELGEWLDLRVDQNQGRDHPSQNYIYQELGFENHEAFLNMGRSLVQPMIHHTLGQMERVLQSGQLKQMSVDQINALTKQFLEANSLSAQVAHEGWMREVDRGYTLYREALKQRGLMLVFGLGDLSRPPIAVPYQDMPRPVSGGAGPGPE